MKWAKKVIESQIFNTKTLGFRGNVELGSAFPQQVTRGLLLNYHQYEVEHNVIQSPTQGQSVKWKTPFSQWPTGQSSFQSPEQEWQHNGSVWPINDGLSLAVILVTVKPYSIHLLGSDLPVSDHFKHTPTTNFILIIQHGNKWNRKEFMSEQR